MMAAPGYSRPHHRRIAQVLRMLDAPLLRDCRCYFGGGTAIVLRHGEYRESVDIDFIVSDRAGFRELRQRCRQNLQRILHAEQAAALQHGAVRTDQYGIRTRLWLDDLAIKFEIVSEGRIELEQPADGDEIAGIATLSRLDMLSTKLLANSDRWADRGVFSRDLIDLAMMQAPTALVRRALGKTELAYGTSVRRDLHQAIDYFEQHPDWADRCLKMLGMAQPRAVLWSRIRRLRAVPAT